MDGVAIMVMDTHITIRSGDIPHITAILITAIHTMVGDMADTGEILTGTGIMTDTIMAITMAITVADIILTHTRAAVAPIMDTAEAVQAHQMVQPCQVLHHAVKGQPVAVTIPNLTARQAVLAS